MKKTTLVLSLLLYSLLSIGQFGPKDVLYPKPDNPTFWNVINGDIDGDGDYDVLTINEAPGFELSWIENLGNGDFAQPKVSTAKTLWQADVVCFDFNNDGFDDILSTTFWQKGLGNGNFDEPTDIASGWTLSALDDVDNDGEIDVVVIKDKTVGWLKNNGSGVPNALDTLIPSADGPGLVHFADMNDDGIEDLLLLSSVDRIVWFYEATGTLSFTLPARLVGRMSSYSELFTYDSDDDGLLDIHCLGHSEVWFRNELPKGFDEVENRKNGTSYQPVIIQDIDNDGDEDYAVIYEDDFGTIGVIVGENKGTELVSSKVSSVKDAYGGMGQNVYHGWSSLKAYILDMVDLDGDNDLDMVLSNKGEVDWFENTGDFKFGPQRPLFRPKRGGAGRAFTLDVDNDGDLDLVLRTGRSNRLVWKENLGKGKYGDANIIDDELMDYYYDRTIYSDFASVDINNDGKMDILQTSSTYSFGGVVNWYKNLGGGNFSDTSTILSMLANTTEQNAKAGDIDGDGDMDLVWSYVKHGWPVLGNIKWKENLGNGQFGEENRIVLTDRSLTFRLVDLDQDGKTDIITSPGTEDGKYYRFSWIQSLGNGQFKTHNFKAPENEGLMDAIPTDFDNDGDIDILHFTSFGPTLTYLSRNKGNQTFGAPDSLGILDTDGSFRPYGNVHLEDIDRDGFKDIAWYVSQKNVWSKNLNGNEVSVPNDISQLGHWELSEFVDFDSDGDPDIVYGGGSAGWLENFSNSQMQLSGKVYYDNNQNGLADKQETGLSQIPVHINSKPQLSYAFSSGSYVFAVKPGVHTVTVPPLSGPWKRTSDSATYTRSVSPTKPKVDQLDFGYYPDRFETILVPKLVGSFPRCSNRSLIWITVKNEGTTRPDGYVHLKLDDSVAFDTSRVKPDSVVGQNVYWSFKNIPLFSTITFRARVLMPGMNQTDNEILTTVSINEVDGAGNVVLTTSDTLKREVRCSYDPNDKLVSPIGFGTEGIIAPTEKLTYRVRFQNTGSDTAFTVVVRDQLDSDLDWGSLKPLSSSHPYTVFVEDDGELVFKFDSILLVDSHANEPESHGYVEYSIMPKQGLRPATTIDGPAKIYFDFNSPISTNTVLNTISCYTAPQPVISLNYPWLEAGVSGDYSFQWYRNDTLIEGATSPRFKPTANATYTVNVEDEYACFKVSAPYQYVMNSIDELRQVNVEIYPNPFSGTTTFKFEKDLDEVDLVITSLVGTEVACIGDIRNRTVTFNAGDLGAGVYLAYLIDESSGQQTFIGKLMAQ